MSNLSQFSNTPAVGEFTVADPVNWALNPTVNGKEYLSNAYKTYSATYANLISAYKYYGYVSQTSTTNSSWNQTNGGSTYPSKTSCTTDGNFNVWHYNKVYSGTSLTSTRTSGGTVVYTAGGMASIINDAIAFGNVVVASWYDANQVSTQPYIGWSTNYGSTWTGAGFQYQVSDTYSYLAQNGSTSAVALCSLSSTALGAVATTTNGTTWTNRAFSADMTVGNTVRIARAAYSAPISAYVYVNANGSIWTSTNGYTLTAGTSPSGMPSAITLVPYFQSVYSASSATSTLIILNNVSGCRLLKITAGPTFSIIDLTALNSYNPVSYPPNSIIYDGARFVLSTPYGQIFYSTDEGVTWTRDYNLWNSSTNTACSPYTGGAYLSSFAYVNSQLIANSYGYASATLYPLLMTNRLLQTDPTYIGNGSTVYYLRIA